VPGNEEVRQLGERRVSLRQSLQCALDAESHLLEPIEGQAGEGLPRRVTHLGLIAAEDVDEQIDHPSAFHLSEQVCDAHETQSALSFIVQSECLACGALDQRLDAGSIGVDELVVSIARSALRVEERRQRRPEIIMPHSTTDTRRGRPLQPG
jgi:hypothetical protein